MQVCLEKWNSEAWLCSNDSKGGKRRVYQYVKREVRVWLMERKATFAARLLR